VGATEPERRSPYSHRRWALALVTVLLGLGIVSASVLVGLNPPRPTKTVSAPASEVILSATEIPEIGWGLRASGTNGTGVWRLFSVHNEFILAFLNVTLWVKADQEAAKEWLAEVGGSAGYPVVYGGVPDADASLFWSYDSAHYAETAVRRYNVVFLLGAYLETSFALTKSDLGLWSGWQLAKIEGLAA